MEIVSKIAPDGEKWCIEVIARAEIRLRPGVVKRRAEKILRLCDYKTKQDAERDEAAVCERVAKNKAFW